KTFATAGTHTVSLVASNGAGSSTATQSFVVAAAPTSSRLAVSSPASSEGFTPTSSGRWRAEVALLGRDSVFLRISSREAGETIVFMRFLNATGHLVTERRLSIQPGGEAVYDLGAYGLRGAFTLELVSAQNFEPTLSVARRPGVREIQR